jgi:hypothetical protein
MLTKLLSIAGATATSAQRQIRTACAIAAAGCPENAASRIHAAFLRRDQTPHKYN